VRPTTRQRPEASSLSPRASPSRSLPGGYGSTASRSACSRRRRFPTWRPRSPSWSTTATSSSARSCARRPGRRSEMGFLGARLLEGVVCLVTGAAQGIGKGVVVLMAGEGARVAVNARVDDDRLEAVVKLMGGLPAPADIADPEAVRRMVEHVERTLGPIEVLVCTAARMTMRPFLEQPPGQWWEQVDVNLTGHMDLIAAVLPGMRRLGRGRIVLISSLWGPTGWENATGYTATKSALISLGR